MLGTLIGELQSGTPTQLLPITVDQFQQMIEMDILNDGDPIELLDGLLVRKDRSVDGDNPLGHHPRHALLILRFQRLLQEICETAGWHLRIQLPVKLNEVSAPEPDIAVVRGSEEDFTDCHPAPDDVILVIEVAGTSVGTDRTTKQRLYASAGIPHYWIANLPEAQVELFEHADPAGGNYRHPMIRIQDQAVSCELAPNHRVEFNVADIFR